MEGYIYASRDVEMAMNVANRFLTELKKAAKPSRISRRRKKALRPQYDGDRSKADWVFLDDWAR